MKERAVVIRKACNNSPCLLSKLTTFIRKNNKTMKIHKKNNKRTFFFYMKKRGNRSNHIDEKESRVL